MRTKKQIEASRINGARSRSRVTAEGKAISSRNAVTHGALACIIVEGENEPKTIDTCRRLVFKHEPEVDFDISETMAVAVWRQRLEMRSGQVRSAEHAVRYRAAMSRSTSACPKTLMQRRKWTIKTARQTNPRPT